MDTPTQKHIALVVYDGVNLLDATGPLQTFDTANYFAASPQGTAYRLEVLARRAGPVKSSSGIEIVATRSYETLAETPDTLLVAGGNGHQSACKDATLLAWLGDMAPRVRRLGSVCSGAFVLAAAGLLEGRRATTHWSQCDQLAAAYPSVTVEPDALFVQDGSIVTAAGVSAGIDLSLALVEDDLGVEVARSVARQMVVFLKRPGGQSQFSVHLETRPAARPSLRDLQRWIPEHLTEDLRVEALAERSAMSPRNFARAFRRETEMSPGKFVEQARVDAACRELEASDLPVTSIVQVCGFGNSEHMRRSFLRRLGVTPSDYRRRFALRGQEGARQ